MPKSTKIMKQNPSLSVPQKVMLQLMKELKIKGTPPANMRGGCKMCDYLAKQQGKTLHPDVRKQLAKALNDFMRMAKKNQRGGGIIQDWFTGKKARRFWSDFGSGFVKGFTGVSKIAAPILDVATIFAPELAPLSIGVNALNKGIGN
jgi:hypothetical protein